MILTLLLMAVNIYFSYLYLKADMNEVIISMVLMFNTLIIIVIYYLGLILNAIYKDQTTKTNE